MLLIMSAFVPARWIGVKPQVSNYTPVDFNKLTTVNDFAKDADGNGQISWKELILSSEGGAAAAQELQNSQPDPKAIAALNDPNNLTSSFSKNLYVASTYLESNNITDEASQQNVVNQLMAEEAAKMVPTTYSFKDLNVVKNEANETVRVYGNAVAVILDDVITEQAALEDLTAVQNFTDTKKAEDLAPLAKNYTRVDAKLKKLLALPVPLSASAYHLLAINRIALYRDTLGDLSHASTDPLRATLAFQKYQNSTMSVLRIHQELSHYFDSKNISFTSKEKGYVFTVGYTPK